MEAKYGNEEKNGTKIIIGKIEIKLKWANISKYSKLKLKNEFLNQTVHLES